MPVQSLAPKQEGVSKKPYTSLVLSRYILIDDQPVKAYDATDEEFYGYVYDLLYRFYEEELKEDAEIVELIYSESFDLDWSDDENRIKVFNEFNRMNRARRTCKLPVISLFV